MEYGIAVKAFIVDKDKLLLIKRAVDEIQNPGIWEIPGGRLKHGEDPRQGLKRETKEETGLEIEVRNPLNVQHFTRNDNMIITMIIFVCRPKNSLIKLSAEHCQHKWVNVENATEDIAEFFFEEVKIYNQLKNCFP